jgi:hypothetical protein
MRQKKQLSASEIAALRARDQRLMELYRTAKAAVEEEPDEVEEKIERVKAYDGDISPVSFMMVLMQMRQQGLKGIPYEHARTFNGWRRAGRMVKRGETCSLFSIKWLDSGSNQETDAPAAEQSEATSERRRCYPKTTHLFHVSQTEEIQTRERAA